MKHHTRAVHFAIALVAGAAGWSASSFSRSVAGEEKHLASSASAASTNLKSIPGGKLHGDSPRRSAEKSKKPPTAARPWMVPAPPLENANAIQANADGSFRVPRSLLHHVRVQLETGDGDLDPAEMRKLGFSPQESEALAAAAEEARAGWAQRETALAVKHATKEPGEMVIIPAWAGDKAGEKNLELAFREIAGARYSFLRRSLEQATQKYVGPAAPRMIHYRRDQDGSHYYQEIELNPKRMTELGPSPGIEDLRAISSGSSSSTESVEPVRRYSHLFPEAR